MRTSRELKERLQRLQNPSIVLPSGRWECQQEGEISTFLWIQKFNPRREEVERTLSTFKKRIENEDFSSDLGEKWKIEGCISGLTWYLGEESTDAIQQCAERLRESESLLKNQFGTCFAVYVNNEAEKGDGWRDALIVNLEMMLLNELFKLKTAKTNLEKAKIYRNVVNYSLMLATRLEEAIL